MVRTANAPKVGSLPSLKVAARQIKTPLHAQIKNSLRQIIESEFADGDRFYTERDLIKHLGASLLTVRRALIDLVGEGLLDRKVGSGTFVRKGGALKSIGIFLPDYTSPVFLEMLEALTEAARGIRARLNVYHTHKGSAAREALQYLKNSPQEEGMVLLGNTTEVNLVLHDALAERGFRIVLLNNFIEGLNANSVRLDDQKTIDAGVKHLRDLGHNRIVFLLNEPLAGASMRTRVKAIERTIAARRLKNCVMVDCGTRPFEDSYEAAYRKMASIMEGPVRPTAIFAISDAGALGALRYCLEKRIAVPGVVSVLGIDNASVSRYSHPPLTSFAHPMKKMAAKAVELLSRREGGGQSYLFAPELVERESTGPAAE